jgi:hypothetical protein
VDADFGVALGHRGSYRYAAHDGDLGLELLGDAEASDDDLGEMIPARADLWPIDLASTSVFSSASSVAYGHAHSAPARASAQNRPLEVREMRRDRRRQ